MYRCEICSDVSRPGQSMLRHTVYRTRRPTPWNAVGEEISREVAVCPTCLRDLETEYLADLITAHQFSRAAKQEQERQRRAERKRHERERLARPQPMSSRARVVLLGQQPAVLAQPVQPTKPVAPPASKIDLKKLGRSVRSGK